MIVELRSLVLCVLLSQSGHAGFLYHDSATSNGGEFSADFSLENLRNGGYSTPAATEDGGVSASKRSYATKSPPTGGYPSVITLNFNAPVSLDAFYLWNHSNSGSATAVTQGVAAFSLAFYSGTGGTGSKIGSTFTGNASKAPASGNYAAQTFNFGTTYRNVRSIVFTANNHNPSSNFVGIREIGFEGTSPPTPTPPSATPRRIIVYLVGGQSNADGYGLSSQLVTALQAPQPEIDFYHSNPGGSSPLAANQWIRLQPGSGSKAGNAGGFGPEISFGVAIHDALGSGRARIAVIKHALGGASLNSDWIAGGTNTVAGDGPIYQAFQSTVGDALATLATLYPGANIQLEGMIWHQGEADSGSKANADAYRTRLTTFIADLRATFGSGLKFGIVQLSDNQTSLDPTGRTTVKLAQSLVAAADPLSYLVTTDDLPMGNSSAIHFGTASTLTIGSRLADGMQLVPIKDRDGNRLDDDWEELHWGVGNTGRNPNGDDDTDGITNLTEFLWMTNPRASNVISPEFLTVPAPTIVWPSASNRRYLIEASDDLGEWRRVDSFIPGSTGATTSFLLPPDTTAPRRFFRIKPHR